MSHAALRRALLLCCAAAMLAAGGAKAALVEFDNLALSADGSFEPRSLPRHRFKPISFQGHVNIRARDGGQPVVLQQAIVGFDRDGRLSVSGLPTCAPEQIADASAEEARQLCRGAIVGSGHVEARIDLSSGPVTASSPLTLFNGPPLNGQPTVVAHARTTVPATQTFAILVPIERRRGEFRYRATLNVPPIAGGLGAITHIDVEVGRRFRAGGQRRSYVSARCSDNIIRTFGRFAFDDGAIIEGAVEKFCRSL